MIQRVLARSGLTLRDSEKANVSGNGCSELRVPASEENICPEVKTLGYTVLIEGEVPEPYRFQFALHGGELKLLDPERVVVVLINKIPILHLKVNGLMETKFVFVIIIQKK